MTTLLDFTDTRLAAQAATDPAERLRTTMAACRVRFTWFGTVR